MNTTVRLASACAKTAFVALFLVYSFLPDAVLQAMLLVALLVMAALSITRVKRVNLAVSAALLLVGGMLLHHAGADSVAWRNAAVENAGLIALMVSTPLLAVCLRYYDFETDIRILAARYVRSSLGFYLLILAVSFVVAMLLNMGAVPLLFYVFEGLRKDYPERTLYNALTRGYFINIMWSPNFISMAVVINSLGVQFGAIVGWGLFLAFLGMGLSVLLEWARLRLRGEMHKKGGEASPVGEVGRDIRKGIYWIAFVVVYVVAGILFLEYALDKGIIVVVPLVSIAAPVLLAACMGKWATLAERLRHYFQVTLNGYNNEIFLFFSAGFLAAAFKSVDTGSLVVEGLTALGVNSTPALVVLLTFFIGLPPLLGVHPIITISAAASVYLAGGLAISQTQMAMVMLTGYHMYATVSPFSSGALLLSNFTPKSPLEISLGLNGLYTLLISFAFMVVIIFM